MRDRSSNYVEKTYIGQESKDTDDLLHGTQIAAPHGEANLRCKGTSSGLAKVNHSMRPSIDSCRTASGDDLVGITGHRDG
ncbi:hypothetical protein T265_07950 [Opisthorchis viverrini]|uniref:Uncharacterized protein n=1 Tax=Opisthorchis viverrini TaxID=6198 RepID=A0A075AA13_OPIVI|nr:hypothetical protein T265_07950 [Opisthorchis viverrini]KER24394.1 hypothetical protein T265_07950 [Opisthorchis viverrini]